MGGPRVGGGRTKNWTAAKVSRLRTSEPRIPVLWSRQHTHELALCVLCGCHAASRSRLHTDHNGRRQRARISRKIMSKAEALEDFWQVLGLESGASKADVQRAYRKKSLTVCCGSPNPDLIFSFLTSWRSPLASHRYTPIATRVTTLSGQLLNS